MFPATQSCADRDCGPASAEDLRSLGGLTVPSFENQQIHLREDWIMEIIFTVALGAAIAWIVGWVQAVKRERINQRLRDYGTRRD